VLEAALALLQEGVIDPTVEQITERSGVSPRSVFRYFDSLDDMRSAVIRLHQDRVRPLLELEPAGSLGERAERLVTTRASLYEQIEGVARAARLREPHVPAIADDLRRIRRVLHDQVRVQFDPELAPRGVEEVERLLGVLDVVLSFESWDLLRRVQEKPPAVIRESWVWAVVTLLTAPPEGGALPHRRGLQDSGLQDSGFQDSGFQDSDRDPR
jgi:AcrR family transcriptional regulator